MSGFLETLLTRFAMHGSAAEAKQIAEVLIENLRLHPDAGDAKSLAKLLENDLDDVEKDLLRALADPAEAKRAADMVRKMNLDDYASDRGVEFVGQVQGLIHLRPELKKALENEHLMQAGVLFGNPKALRRAEKEAFARRNVVLLEFSTALDFSGARAKQLLSEAISEVADPGLKKDLLASLETVSQAGIISDFEELALKCRMGVKTLKAHQIAQFEQIVQKKACEDLLQRIESVLEKLQKTDAIQDSDRVLKAKIRDAFDLALQGPNPSSDFRKAIFSLSEDFGVALTARLNGDEFIKGVLTVLVKDSRARAALKGFDQDGLRRLFEAWASFGKKAYTVERSNAAGRNLIGWLYEASRFNKDEMLKASNAVFGQLAAPLKSKIPNLAIEAPRMHFDIWRSAKKSGATSLQGADHMGTIAIRYKNNVVHVAVAFGEHKGISGIAAGENQLRKIGSRYRDKVKVHSENGDFEMGATLFTDLDAALRRLGIPDTERVEAIKAVGGTTRPYKKVVIYPPDTAAGKGVRTTAADTAIVAHDIARDDMMGLYASFSTFFGLSPIAP